MTYHQKWIEHLQWGSGSNVCHPQQVDLVPLNHWFACVHSQCVCWAIIYLRSGFQMFHHLCKLQSIRRGLKRNRIWESFIYKHFMSFKQRNSEKEGFERRNFLHKVGWKGSFKLKTIYFPWLNHVSSILFVGYKQTECITSSSCPCGEHIFHQVMVTLNIQSVMESNILFWGMNYWFAIHHFHSFSITFCASQLHYCHRHNDMYMTWWCSGTN